jgi:hypothetical protein
VDRARNSFCMDVDARFAAAAAERGEPPLSDGGWPP